MTATVAGLITYAALRGTTIANDAATAVSLQRASDYIRTRYVIRYSLDATTDAVIEATYIAVPYDIATPGFWQTTFTPAQTKVLTQADTIKWEVTGGATGADAQLPTSPAIDALLSPYMGSAAMMLVV